jgi:uncharacterized membrane protein YjfL (UPF0719 family)
MGFLHTIFYSAIGIALLILGWKAFEIILPFGFMERIKEENNIPLAVCYAGVVVAIGIVIAASIVSR